MDNWEKDLRMVFEIAKLETEREIRDLRNKINSGEYSSEQKAFISDFIKTTIKEQFKKVDELVDQIDENDKETLIFLLEFIQYFKKVEEQLKEILGED